MRVAQSALAVALEAMLQSLFLWAAQFRPLGINVRRAAVSNRRCLDKQCAESRSVAPAQDVGADEDL
jgi:hypothetical protein